VAKKGTLPQGKNESDTGEAGKDGAQLRWGAGLRQSSKERSKRVGGSRRFFATTSTTSENASEGISD